MATEDEFRRFVSEQSNAGINEALSKKTEEAQQAVDERAKTLLAWRSYLETCQMAAKILSENNVPKFKSANIDFRRNYYGDKAGFFELDWRRKKAISSREFRKMESCWILGARQMYLGSETLSSFFGMVDERGFLYRKDRVSSRVGSSIASRNWSYDQLIKYENPLKKYSYSSYIWTFSASDGRLYGNFHESREGYGGSVDMEAGVMEGVSNAIIQARLAEEL
ncbi:hypothetical protein RF641_04720 [Arthrobacter sp. LS16]|uniref:hypothetical protein n=1 Tax=Arthrobacter sp. 'calajunan' TaxID=1690248 RepID=UPI003C714815